MTTTFVTPLGHTCADQRRTDRRISPAIGEFAIADRARLVEENRRLRALLADYVSTDAERFGPDSWVHPHNDRLYAARAAVAPAQEGK